MSKTIVGLLEIGVGIALEFTPFAAVGSSLILAGLATEASVLFAPAAQKPEQTETALKSPTPARVSGYGRNRLYMAYALYVTANDGTAVDVGVFHDGKIDGIERYWLGDTKIVLLGDGRVQAGEAGQFGELSDIVKIYTRLGNATETAFSQVIAKVPDQWTSAHRGDGCVTACVLSAAVKAKNYQMIYPTGGPNQMPLSMAMRLQLCFDWRDETQSPDNPATWKWTENAILHLAHYEMVRDNKDWETHFLPTIDYWTAAADDCDLGIPLKGVQTIMLEAADAGSGHLTLSSVNGLSTGMTIVISATGDTSLTETRTVTGISGAVVALSSNLSNDHPNGSQVTWSSASGSPATEPRYRSCVAHKHTDDHKSVIANLLACCDGWMAPRSDGALVVYSGRYQAPTVTLGPDEITSYSLQDGIDEENAINQIAVTYVSENHDFNVVDTDAWEDDDDIAARGKILADSLSNQVPSFSQARRLAKRAMAKIMAPERGTFSTNSAGRIARGQRYIRLQLIDAGTTFLDAPVEITKLTRNLTTGGVTCEWILADPNIDAWNPATEEGEPAPVGNRIAPAPLAAPTITGAVADFAAVADDGTGVRITVIAAGLDRADVQWYARWRLTGAPTWNEQQYTDIDSGPSVTLETGFVPTGQSIDVEVAYGTGDGRVSPYSDTTVVDTATDATAPDAATSITVASWADTLSLVTDRIARASSYRWRIYADDGTTLIRTIVTKTPAADYTSAQAATDGVARSYVVTVAGVNAGGGAGTEASTGVISLPAPAVVTGFTATGGATEAEIDFDASTDPSVAGYLVATSTVSGFDPLTQGSGEVFDGSPAFLQNFAAGTFYTKMAAFDAWTTRPDLLNFTAETTFTITTGGGGIGGGGGGGGGGTTCPEISMPILMANDGHDGPGAQKPAGDVVVGDWVWTQPELDDGLVGEWGAYQVSAVVLAEAEVMKANIGIRPMRATPEHTMWLSGWVRMDAYGTPDGTATVAKITVDTAHTYYGNGILHHNIRNKGLS